MTPMPSVTDRSPLRLVRVPGRIDSALELFRELSGLTAVTSLVAPPDSPGQLPALSPPLHPRCAAELQSVQTLPPCREQWLAHVRSAYRSPSVHSHTCPVGLRCSCVPIWLGGSLVGVVKLVAGAETPRRIFAAATRLLELSVCAVCQESLVSDLTEQVEELRRCLAAIREVEAPAPVPEYLGSARSRGPAHPGTLALVDNALRYLHANYQRPGLSLPAIAEALRCNPRYLTTRFTTIVGERMHSYLQRLRVANACRLLVDTDAPIKQVAYCSGFHDNAALARVFRCILGVSPLEYRRIFRTGAGDESGDGNVATSAPAARRPDGPESTASDSGRQHERSRCDPQSKGPAAIPGAKTNRTRLRKIRSAAGP